MKFVSEERFLVKKFFSVIISLFLIVVFGSTASASEFFFTTDPSVARVVATAVMTVNESVATLSGVAYDAVIRVPAPIRVYQVMGLVILAPQWSTSIRDALDRSGSFAVIKAENLKVDWARGRDCYESNHLGSTVTCVFDAGTEIGALNGAFEIRMPSWWLFGATDPTQFFGRMFDELAPTMG